MSEAPQVPESLELSIDFGYSPHPPLLGQAEDEPRKRAVDGTGDETTKISLFAKSETRFFLKVVDSQEEFFMNGRVPSCCTTTDTMPS